MKIRKKLLSTITVLVLLSLSIVSVFAGYITSATGYLYTGAVYNRVMASGTTKASFSANELRQTYTSTSGAPKSVRSKTKTSSLTSSGVDVGDQSIPSFVVQIKHEVINNSTYETKTTTHYWADI